MTEISARVCKKLYFTTHDGVKLMYRHWPSNFQKSRGAIVMFHRGHEHSGRMEHIVNELGLKEFDFFAWDARGHGESPGKRGFSPSLNHSVKDVDTFVRHIQASHRFIEEKIAVIAQSVGAVLVATWLHDYAPRVRCAVLASPAFDVNLIVPLALPGLKLMRAIRGHFFVNSYVKGTMLTHDPARAKSYKEDPLITLPISVDILFQLRETSKRIIEDAQAIVTPIQLLISGKDKVVYRKPQEDFFQALGSTVKEKHLLEGFYHDTLGELDREKAFVLIRKFLIERFESELSYPDLKEQHKQGFTYSEALKLAAPPETAYKKLYWNTFRKSLKFAGSLSDGIKLGHETGFDSGSTLDYVYRNKSQGKILIGKVIDYNYLNSPGWTGIRQRKKNIEALLLKATELLRNEGSPVNILDIASGHGRYLLEEIANMSKKPESVTLRDYSVINVKAGNELIQKLKLDRIAKFIKADAFDPMSIALTSPKTTIGVVSGLYELFSDNEMVSRSLFGMSKAIKEGGYLIYTGQPWHPQLELIARALTSHRQGQAWVMRRRTQAEMDQLVVANGFEKIDQLIDDAGIFTVSLAKKIG